jgi:hypothetical protein
MALTGPSANSVLCAADYTGWNHQDIELADACSISNCGLKLNSSRTGYVKHYEPFGGQVYTSLQACATRFPSNGEFAIAIENRNDIPVQVSLGVGHQEDVVQMLLDGPEMSTLIKKMLIWADCGDVAALPNFWLAGAIVYGARMYYKRRTYKQPWLKQIQAVAVYVCVFGLLVSAIQFTLVILLAIPNWDVSVLVTSSLHVLSPLLAAYFIHSLSTAATFEAFVWDDFLFPLGILVIFYLPWFAWQGFGAPFTGGLIFWISSAIESRGDLFKRSGAAYRAVNTF